MAGIFLRGWIATLFAFGSVVGAEQRIHLETNLNLVSLNVNPEQMYREGEDRGLDLDLMFEQVNQNGHSLIIVVRDNEGRSYVPNRGIREIPYWDLNAAYHIRMESPANLTFVGDQHLPDEPIVLHEGWNAVAYLPDYELSCARPDFYVLQSILHHVRLANNDSGFASPRNNFSNMRPWKPGAGYRIEVAEACTLIYPPRQNQVDTQLAELPREMNFLQAYPNPFNSATTISFDVPRAEYVRLVAVDPLGRRIEELLPAQMLARGRYEVVWNAGNRPTGAYIIGLESESRRDARVITMVR